MRSWHIRIALARLGFRTQSRLDSTPGGAHFFGLWAQSWFWNGIIAEVCLNDHVAVDPEKPETAIAGMRRVHENVFEACTRGLREFPDSVPRISGTGRREDGRLQLEERSWPRIETAPDRRVHPTEDIPTGIEDTDLPGDPILEAGLDLARHGLRVEDSLDPFFGRQRLIRDCQDRSWGYRARPALPRINGRLIRGTPVEVSTTLIDPGSATRILRGAGEALLDRFRQRPGQLPPGFSHVPVERSGPGAGAPAPDPA